LIGCDIGGAKELGSDLMNTNSVFNFAIDGVHSLKKRGFTGMEIMSALLRETRSAVGVFGSQKKRGNKDFSFVGPLTDVEARLLQILLGEWPCENVAFFLNVSQFVGGIEIRNCCNFRFYELVC